MYAKGDFYFIMPAGRLFKLTSVYRIDSLQTGLHRTAVCANLQISEDGMMFFWLNKDRTKEMMTDDLFPEIIMAMKHAEMRYD